MTSNDRRPDIDEDTGPVFSIDTSPLRSSLFARPRTHPLPLSTRLTLVARTYLPLGFISFGGPGVHVVLLRQCFVEQLKWIDLRTFLDLFALGNALPGPGSTQIAFSIATVTHGVLPGLVAFLCWSLPGAVGMTLLGAGVGKIPEDLHPAVLAALTGLNAAAVGLIALSAEQLGKASATDKLTLLIIWASASAGICYHAPWMYPVLIVAGGSVTLVWDLRRWWMRPFKRVKELVGRSRAERADEWEMDGRNMSNGPSEASIAASSHSAHNQNHIPLETPASAITTNTAAAATSTTHLHRPALIPSAHTDSNSSPNHPPSSQEAPSSTAAPTATTFVDPLRVIPSGVAYALIAGFVLVLAIPLAVRAGLAGAGKEVPRALSMFANFLLSGTIIFGGGPVVIPLLRDYVVAPGWVSNRDFLLIFAILQAFPGPNFNFALALGYLAISPSSVARGISGALLSYLAIFLPGLLLMFAFLPIYSVFRLHPVARSAIRGLNAAATGLVWVAVWQLFLVGHIYVGPQGQAQAHGQGEGRVRGEGGGSGQAERRALNGPLTADPFWAVVAAAAFLACRNYGVPPWAGVLGGGAAGAGWYGVTR